MASPLVHRFRASLFPVNAYLLELADGIVVIDSTLGMSDGRALRARVDATDKPLRAVIVTHTHPDHYGGLTALLEGSEGAPRRSRARSRCRRSSQSAAVGNGSGGQAG